ncbi:hypothetical protein [Schlesneria sp.]|uniref:hypothetical protein n=1 Tax=Schlesneria sp. TaxID=2762018 RepID=UPI002EFDE816
MTSRDDHPACQGHKTGGMRPHGSGGNQILLDSTAGLIRNCALRRSFPFSVVSSLACAGMLIGSALPLLAAPDDIEQKQEAVPVEIGVFQMDENNFDANVFQPSGNPKQARQLMEKRFNLQLDELNRVCQLTEAQKQKFKLAAGADLQRFFNEVDVLRKKVTSGKLNQNDWNNFWQEVQPLRNRQMTGLFGETSFFSKTIRKTLTEDQLSKYDAVMNDRRRFRYRAAIEVALTNMERVVPLNQAQHNEIAKILLDETRPPEVFGQYDQYVVTYYLANLPEARLKGLLEDHQWKLMKNQLDQNRGMEQFLIQNGILPKEKERPKLLRARVRQMVLHNSTAADAEVPANKPDTH